jgi:hypothetical protein
MPLICYQPRKFSAPSMAIVTTAQEIIRDYASQGLTLTLRQLYYRFVARDAIPNTEKSYKRVGSIINDARLAGLLDWDAIEDRGRELHRSSHWDTPADIIDTAARGFSMDRWAGQHYRVEVWVEKQALEAIVGMAAGGRDCPYFACKGYTSQSEMWRAAMRMKRYRANRQSPVVIHLGDHDPSGMDMTRDITERINATFGVNVEVLRIALNMDQVEEYDPPPNPAKTTDSRFEGYAAEFGDESWELDALEPATLHSLITEAIDQCLDRPLYDAVVARETEAKAVLGKLSDRWPDVAEMIAEMD